MEGLVSFLPMIAIFVLFYFLLIRPQQKRAKEHKNMLDALQKGDEVMTNGGIVGRIVKVSEQYLTLEVAENVNIHFQRGAVATRLEKGSIKDL